MWTLLINVKHYHTHRVDRYLHSGPNGGLQEVNLTLQVDNNNYGTHIDSHTHAGYKVIVNCYYTIYQVTNTRNT